jgi:hypothetical protein
MTQLKLGSFSIELSPTPEALPGLPMWETTLGPVVEETVGSYLRKLFPDTYEYVLLANIEDISNSEPSTTVIFKGGVISFKEEPIEDVGALVKAAIDANLAVSLKEEKPYAAIETATYVNLTPIDLTPPTVTPDTLAPLSVDVTINGAEIGDIAIEDESSKNVGMIVGSVLGALMVLFGAAILVKRKKRHREVHMPPELDLEQEKSADAAANVVEDEADGAYSEMAQYRPGELLDAVSVGSEWTISTNDCEDPYGVSAQQRKRDTELRVSSETFDRDRQITLQKDMLQSEWTGNGAAMNGQLSRTPRDWAAGNGKRKSKSKPPSLSFQGAYEGQGEEIYLVPPSRPKKSSTREII